MEINDVKKELYKSKATASLLYIRSGFAYYSANVYNEQIGFEVRFTVPVNDMGDANFYPLMEAKYLIRWIVNYHS